MANDLTKLESAAVTIAAGAHGHVPPEQLAASSVLIAADVLSACADYVAAQEAKAKEDAATEKAAKQAEAAEKKAAK